MGDVVNGYLKIKTKIDNKGIDKDVTELENKIKKLQTDNKNSSEEQRVLQQEIDNYEKLIQEAEQYRQKLKELDTQKDIVFNSNPALAFQGNLPEYENIKEQVASMQQKYAQATIEIDKQAPKIDKIYNKLEKVKTKQTENNTKITQFKQKIDQINIKKVEESLNNVGRNIQGQIGKIGKMAMAVFGIRTAFSAVRNAISAVSQYNTQIAADFEYMRYCIANLLAPAVQGLIKLLYTVLSYINAITSAWFGINLFSSSSVKNFQKMQKSASGTAKAMKEMDKTRTNFDEMNVLQDNSNNSSGTGGGAAVTPSTDLSGIQAEVPAWLQWIIDNKDLILQIIAGVIAGIIALKLGIAKIQALGIGIAMAGIVSLVQNIINFIKDPSWENFSNILLSLSVVLGGIALIVGGSLGVTIAGIAALIAGVAMLIKGVINYLENPTWENFITILGGIAIAVGAVLLLIGGIPALITAIILLIAAVGLAIYKHWDEVKEVLGKVGQWIYDNMILPVWNLIKALFNQIVTTFNNLGNFMMGICTMIGGILRAPFENLWSLIQTLYKNIKNILQGIVTIFRRYF